MTRPLGEVTIQGSHEHSEGQEPTEGPTRRCVGCGEPALKSELERFVYHDDVGLLYDLRKKAPGRGVYLHADPECVRQAALRGGFARGFKRRVIAEPDAILEDLRRGIWRRLQESMQVALQSQHLGLGSGAVGDAMKRDEVELVLLASDAGDSTRRKYASNADRKNIPVCDALTGEQMASLVGRDCVVLISIASSIHRDKVRRDIEKLRRLDAL